MLCISLGRLQSLLVFAFFCRLSLLLGLVVGKGVCSLDRSTWLVVGVVSVFVFGVPVSSMPV